MDYIKRNIEETIIKLNKKYPVIIITGARQVGKTTLLNFIKQKDKINYVTLDDIKVRTLALENPQQFLKQYEAPLIIDEFQYAPSLLKYITTTNKQFYLIQNDDKIIDKEVGILNLYGLSNREINGYQANLFIPSKKNLKIESSSLEALYKRILKGSFPILYNTNIDKNTFYDNYIKTYIERDIRELINIKDEIKFMKFISAVAFKTGQELIINDICKEVDITNPTALTWLSILFNTGIIYLLQPLSNKVGRIIKRPKIYFMDTGLACYLMGYTNSKAIENNTFILETYVVSEIIKSFSNNGLKADEHLFYYRDNNNHKIDLLIIYHNTVYPIKISKSFNMDFINNFKFVNNFKMKVGSGAIICIADKMFQIDKNNYCIPIEYI
ncbi:MAG: DUF4143 domain-containing protein [Bacilli bacterium]